jgi:hypothetical protein
VSRVRSDAVQEPAYLKARSPCRSRVRSRSRNIRQHPLSLAANRFLSCDRRLTSVPGGVPRQARNGSSKHKEKYGPDYACDYIGSPDLALPIPAIEVPDVARFLKYSWTTQNQADKNPVDPEQ